MAANLDIEALRKMFSDPWATIEERHGAISPHVDALLDAAEERDRLRTQRDALLAALEPIVWQLESAQRSTAPAFLKGFQMNDTESGALLRAIAAKKETP